MSLRQLLISDCTQCPNFSKDYFGNVKFCRLLVRMVTLLEEDLYNYPIPEDCPLPKVDKNDSV